MEALPLIGRYARTLAREAAGRASSARALTAMAALAAYETQARLGWTWPVAVRGPDVAPDTAYARWDAPAPEGLRTAAIDAAAEQLVSRAADGSEADAFAVDLTTYGPEPIPAPALDSRAAVHVEASLASDLVVRVRLRDPHGAHAAHAVAEVFAEILHALLAHAAPATHAAPGLGDASRAHVLGPLSGGGPAAAPEHRPAFDPIPHAILRQAHRHPERVAYHFEDRTLTYGALAAAAQALTGRLAAAGVGHGALVPVLIDHGFELPLAFLAVLARGAAFVPLDPTWPEARIAEALALLDAAGPPGGGCGGTTPTPILCTGPMSATPLPAAFRARAMLVADTLVEVVAAPPQTAAAPLPAPLAPTDCIYAIFTSGTTGRPRAALNTHGALANRFAFMSHAFEAVRGPVLQTTRPTFDSAVWQLLWPLTRGGAVVLTRPRDALDPPALVALIARHAVALTDLVPTLLVPFVAAAERDPTARTRLRSLRALIVGGEAIAPRAVHRLRALLPDLAVHNAYGPTEAAIGMVFHAVTDADGDHIPLGRPIDHCHVVVVDDALGPLPQGAIGELLLGGACVGAGYLGAPEDTARAFIANAFGAAIPGPRLYRSGDLGYFDHAGLLRFVGRRDDQIKLAGVRIELGEITAIAARHPAVRQARALAIAGPHGPSVALCVAAGDLANDSLRAFLASQLPRAALPRHILIMPELPVGAHGKTDLPALRQLLAKHLATPPEPATGSSRADLPLPLIDQLRVLVAQATASAPGHAPDAPLADDGLDSLGALTLALAIAEHFDVTLGASELLEAPSLAHLAARIADARPVATADLAPMAQLAQMERDAGLAMAYAPASAHAARRHPPRTVFLTGASGFVGSYLAHALLSAPDLTLIALSRDRLGADLVQTLATKGLWRPDFAPRLQLVRGDLTRPHLGLAPATHAHIAATCDAIVHAGARVNLLFDYAAHRATNVLGTASVAELATLGRPKVLHHISTLGVVEHEALRRGAPVPEACLEGLGGADFAPPTNGYSRSKWIAERLLARAHEAGLAVTLHRLGEVMPAAHGAPNPRALTHLFLAACAALGAVPDVPLVSDWSPVDWVARAVVGAILGMAPRSAPASPNTPGPTIYHHVHPTRVRFDQAFANAGLTLARLPAAAWHARLATRARAPDAPRSLALLAALVPTPDALATLLTDNPRLVDRRHAAALGAAIALAEPDARALASAIAAYLGGLVAAHPTAP